MPLPEHARDSSPHHDPTPSGGSASLSPACIHGTLPKTLFQNGLHPITMIYFSVRCSRWTAGSLRVKTCLLPFVAPASGLGPATVFADKQTCPAGRRTQGDRCVRLPRRKAECGGRAVPQARRTPVLQKQWSFRRAHTPYAVALRARRWAQGRAPLPGGQSLA